MTRTLVPLLLVLTATPAGAQQPAPIMLTLQPRVAPVPALQYRLLPDLRERTSGNAAQLYFRAFSPDWQWFRRDPKFLSNLTELSQKPLRDLKVADFAPFASVLQSKTLGELDRAARRSTCDWELIERAKEDGIGLLLPELQGLREFATLLRMRARLEMLDGKYETAARTLQTGLTMARHTAEGPTLIHALVGVAIANLMLQVVDDWVERPDAPNLYWALTNLPQPLIDLRTGLQGERLFIDNLFPGYREMRTDLTAAHPFGKAQATLQQYTRMLSLEDVVGPHTPLLMALRAYPEGKRFLRQQGHAAEKIEALPALQVVFLYEVYLYDTAFDDLVKWTTLPYPEAAPQLHRVVEGIKDGETPVSRSTLVRLLIPAIEKVVGASVRLQRKVEALRCIEALRLHAAAKGGGLPSKLEEVTEVPLPLDPWTGKAFAYSREDGKATLTGLPHAGEQPNQNNSLRYVVSFRPARNPKEEKPGKAPSQEARPAANPQTGGLAPLIDEETIAVVRLDLSRIDMAGFFQTLTKLLPNNDELANLGKRAREFQAAFTQAGVTELVVFFSTADLPAPSFLQMTLKEKTDTTALELFLKGILGPRTVTEKRGTALVAGSRSALARLAKNKPFPRSELAPALTAAGTAGVQVFLLPTDDQRRVIEEMVSLPIPGGSGRTLTQGIRWAALAVEAGPKPAFKLMLHAADDASAKKIADLVKAGFTVLGQQQFPGDEKSVRDLFPKEFTAVTEAFKPAVAGQQVTMEMRDPAALGALTGLALAIEQLSGQVRSEAGHHLKQILIALHSYHDAMTTFPAHALYSKEGKPLLSWRVALLPYLEQGPLYKEFHLDEPWDSPHNKKLIAKIPAIYRNPKIKDAREGLTTYLTPINKAFLFTGSDKGLQIKDLEDGTANTAIVVDVADEAGVIWTKPDDLVVNEKDPWKGLIGHNPNFVLVGMADGSVQQVNKKVSAKVLWAVFTRAGGEVLPDLSK